MLVYNSNLFYKRSSLDFPHSNQELLLFTGHFFKSRLSVFLTKVGRDVEGCRVWENLCSRFHHQSSEFNNLYCAGAMTKPCGRNKYVSIHHTIVLIIVEILTTNVAPYLTQVGECRDVMLKVGSC